MRCSWAGVSVATISNVSILLVSLEWHGGSLGEEAWTVMMLVVAFLLGITISIAYRNFIYPIVIAWASIAIWAANKEYHTTVAVAALTAGIVLIVWAIGYGLSITKTEAEADA